MKYMGQPPKDELKHTGMNTQYNTELAGYRSSKHRLGVTGCVVHHGMTEAMSGL